MNEPNQSSKKKHSNKDKDSAGMNAYVKFSGIALQMGIIIGGAAWGGVELDRYFNNETPIWALICSLSGVGIALYVVFRAVNKMSDE